MPAKTKPADYSHLIPTDPDASIHGALAIAIADNLVKPDGTPNTRQAQYRCECGYYDVDKIGRLYRSTINRIRNSGKRRIPENQVT
jgi:hypothetical protein